MISYYENREMNKKYENENSLYIFLLKTKTQDSIYTSSVRILGIVNKENKLKYYNMIMLYKIK